EIDLDTTTCAARGFAGRAGQTGRAHVLNSGNCVASDQFEACFKQQFLFEWITDLHSGTIFSRLFGQFAGSKRRTCETVAACFGADVEYGITRALRGAARELFVAQDSEAKNVDQRVTFEAFIEMNFAANGGNAYAIAVMRDTRDDTCE